MARNTFPNATEAVSAFGGGANSKIVVTLDQNGLTLADIQTLAAVTIANSVVTLDATGTIPQFLGPNDGRTTLYAYSQGGSPGATVRLDAVPPPAQAATATTTSGTATTGDGLAGAPSNLVPVDSYNLTFNGTTWDRTRNVNAIGDANPGTGMQANGMYAYNGATWDRVRIGAPADAQSNSTAASHSTSFNQVYNGATWDRTRSPSADGAAVTGFQAYVDMLYNGATFDRNRGVGAVTDTYTGAGVSADADMLYNGATWERNRAVGGAPDAFAGTGMSADSDYLYNGATWDRNRSIQGVTDAYAGTGVDADSPLYYNGTTYDRGRNAAGAAMTQAGKAHLMTTGLQPGTSLTAVAVPTAGTVFDLFTVQLNLSLQVVYTVAPTATSVNLEGSLDGTNFFVLATSTNTAGDLIASTTKPVRYVRANLTAYTGAGTATAMVAAA